MPFYPGPGIGGHCIQIDPLYLSFKTKQHGEKMSLINTSLKSTIGQQKISQI